MNLSSHLHRMVGVAMCAALLSGCYKEKTPKMERVPGLLVASATPTPTPAPDKPAGDAAATTTSVPMMNNGKPIPQAPDTKVLIGGNKLQVADIAFTVPVGWKSVTPSSSFRKAQFELLGKAGDAELAVFYFGPGQGGSVEDNVRRWAAQFTSDDATTASGADVARLSHPPLDLALVKTSGTYDAGSMPGMPGASSGPKKNWALFGVVIEGGPEGTLYIKVTGPKATMDEQDKNLEDFAQSAKISDYK